MSIKEGKDPLQAVLCRDTAKVIAVLTNYIEAQLCSENQQQTKDGENDVEVKSS